jgi:tripartite-type tricarboxylate transporter receptor subunit TctC
MKHHLQDRFALLLSGACCMALAAPSFAQVATYPTKSIRLIVPFGVGGSSDNAWRIVAPKLAEALGQQVIIDNRAGAGGTIGAALALTPPADGYTLLGTANVHALSGNLYKGLSYHPVNDFEPIAQFAESCTVLVVHPSLPVWSTKELIALAKTKPGKIDFSSAGVGTGQHMFMMLFMSMTGIEMTHVPYKSTNIMIPDLIAGRVQANMSATSITVPHVSTGRLRALAVSSARRSQFIPDVPTLAESGVKGYEAALQEGVLARKGVPAEVVSRLESELRKIMNQPDVQKQLLATGSEPAFGTAAQWGAVLKSDYDKWGKLIQKAGIKVE